MISPTADLEQPPAEPQTRTFALRSGSVPLFTPLVMGFVAYVFAHDVIEEALKGHPTASPVVTIVIGLMLALASTALASALLRRSIPDAVRLTAQTLDLLRGKRIVRRVHLAGLKEVSEFQTPAKVLLIADKRRHITLPSFSLVEPRAYEEISQQLVETLGRIDPTGGVARGAVLNGRLRETISQQPVRGTLLLAGVLVFASVMASRGRIALQGTPFPEEALGALSTPLLLGGELFRLLSYVFVHVSWRHLAVCTVGILYIGGYLEKLLGWERVLMGFVAGAIGAAVGHVLYGFPLPAMGASGALFGLFGMLGAVAVIKRRLPPTLLPHPGFWLLCLLLGLQLNVDTQTATQTALPFISPEAHLGGAIFGFLVGLMTVIGVEVPPAAEARNTMRPFAILGCVALLIGLVGGVLTGHGRNNDSEIVANSLINLPKSATSAVIQNVIAYPRLIDPKSTAETVELATRIAAAAVKNTNREDPGILDTLAAGLYRQGHIEEARNVMSEALKLPIPDEELKGIKQHAEDMASGAPLRPDPPREP